GHLAGNLNELRGPEAMNGYAAGLRELGWLLWALRAIVFVGAVLHIWAATALTLENRRARPQHNVLNKHPAASYASRTMIWSGVILLAFVVYHLLHFTFGVTNPAEFDVHDAKGRHDVYRMVIAGFSNPVLSFSYMLAVGFLCIHLSHGFASVFRST